MSVLAIVLIAIGVVVLLVLAGGFVAVRRRSRAQAGVYAENVAACDQALEQARAADKGWDREVMEEAVRKAVSEARPGWTYDNLHLVLVDDRPGVMEDRAQFMAVGDGEEVRIALARRDEGWFAERIE
jgi:type II secretory pathway pseudopilin PulG